MDRCELLCLDLDRAEAIRHDRLDQEMLEVVARQMRALADPTRLSLVDALARTTELCVCDLGWITGRAQNLVSHHLRALKVQGLAQSRPEGKIVFYSLTATGRRLYASAVAGAEVAV